MRAACKRSCVRPCHSYIYQQKLKNLISQFTSKTNFASGFLFKLIDVLIGLYILTIITISFVAIIIYLFRNLQIVAIIRFAMECFNNVWACAVYDLLRIWNQNSNTVIYENCCSYLLKLLNSS